MSEPTQTRQDAATSNDAESKGTSPAKHQAEPTKSKESAKSKWRSSSVMQQLLTFASLAILVIIFGVLNPKFLQPGNISDILLSTVVIGLLALGATLVIVTGGIDLSVGTGMTLCSVMIGVAITNLGLPIWLGVLVGLGMGGLIAAINGFLVSYLGFPPFIATLAMMMVAQGLSLVISGTKPIYFADPAFSQLALAKPIPGLVIPSAVFIFFGAAVVAGIILSKTLLGRYALSIGSNEEATALSGVNVRSWKFWVYAVSGLFTGLAAVMIAARLGSAQPGLGMGYELQAIAAVVIGGTSLSGGKGSITGTVVGALIMSVLTNGLRVISVPQEWQNVAIGVAILLAVYLDMVRKKKASTV